ncbi:hypothetical protein GUITHDRAFT_159919 [Guillardia theta CCMP2712]|uniref:Phosphoribosylformylglycinamidine synthase n=1 Tax=Guillardia theta (strain CCMP2712) TaxID=905079 RepID=L1IXI9_GUITC|nr:hypothetical protein GUITHDRAFT_159919 [Guillardia theta CCMP2712]EKX40946.1 hypothetical protein GUITHDRAFT_159919 [Guillardia theta CCMP2712]|eukprot:XP_005827926.1 hypothetical protein GUITHDRAFT_159919 [Guillardia theta CCMP2712]
MSIITSSRGRNRSRKSAHALGLPITSIETEFCFNVSLATPSSFTEANKKMVEWCLKEGGHKIGPNSFLSAASNQMIVEVGPRMNFTTAWSTNCVSVLQAAEIHGVPRVERSRRFLVTSSTALTADQKLIFISIIHDRMTEMVYPEPLKTFETGITPKPVKWIPVMKEGRKALEAISAELGLGFDDWDYEYYLDLYKNELKRDPSDVELFDLAQSNSEHSRHWFFGGIMKIDGEAKDESLFRIVKDTLEKNPNTNKNSIIAFADNSSSIIGAKVHALTPAYNVDKSLQAGAPCPLVDHEIEMDLIYTAETHNMPTGVCPFAGAETGTGGRLRDVMATGIGAHYIAGTIGYCVGALNMPGTSFAYEDAHALYPPTLAKPLDILIEGSNGASDYGNKFGEPLIAGFTRSFGMRTAGGERREWIKPILFTGGFGQMDARHRKKGTPEVGMKVLKFGGPAYRIGMGGGAASSMAFGDQSADLDFNAVQRGDAEMEQKMNRVMRACIELGERNPIVSLHDQGAGGNCNVCKEIIEPVGGKINIRDVVVGDNTMSVLEIWGAEYQENNCALVRAESMPTIEKICERERSGWCCVGEVTGDGRCVVVDSQDGSTPVDLPLEKVLGKLPPKTFVSNHSDIIPAADPPSVMQALLSRSGTEVLSSTIRSVLSTVTVGSKRFLTNKVDRSVTGLIAQQQCVGPLLTPLADCAVVAHSHLTRDGEAVKGGVTAIGEQPIKGLLSGAANARMSVAEGVTNLVWAKVTALEDVKAEGNWMWAAKLPGEGALMYDTAVALREIMHELGIGIDGGKDSLSMSARVQQEVVKSPGEITVSLYCSCPDVTLTVTPDLKNPPGAALLLVQPAGSKARCGGSVFAQVHGRLGDEPADCEGEETKRLKAAFKVTQELIGKRMISAGHDRSDGGLASAVLEMAFAGNCGVRLDVAGAAGATTLAALFNEEVGLVMEVAGEYLNAVMLAYADAGVSCVRIGEPLDLDKVEIVGKSGKVEMEDSMTSLRDCWESTSFGLDKLQANPDCVEEEEKSMKTRKTPLIHATILNPQPQWQLSSTSPKVAIIREEGSNGDREMSAAFRLAGFEPWDVTMSDLASKRASLSSFRGLAFVGGFSYADVLGSAKGWAATAMFHPVASQELRSFYERSDTFSLGVCNGCQLEHRLQWVPFGPGKVAEEEAPRLEHNKSARFESRWINVKIEKSKCMWFKDMEGSLLGIWSAHGEGRFSFPNEQHYHQVENDGQVALRFVDDDGLPTERYPFNPNGSPGGIAGLCTKDGRHLAMMPHPERCVLKWQIPWMPRDWQPTGPQAAPWLQMFINARKFVEAS